jgi:hypothetical protein
MKIMMPHDITGLERVNYHHSLHNSPEERSSYLLRGGSLKCFEASYRDFPLIGQHHKFVSKFIIKFYFKNVFLLHS